MPVRLFPLRGVPEDEAEEVRELLTDNAIDFFETPAGNWGISMPALWLNDETQRARALALIKKYQEERLVRVREAYAREKKEGKNMTIMGKMKENPVRFIVYLAAIAVIVYLSTKPFMELAK